MYIVDNHSKFQIIPHGQQIDHTIGQVNLRHSFQDKTAIKRGINKPVQLMEIWGPFLVRPETFRVDFG